MVSTQKAQTGKRVYKGVSQSPNKGPVSAKGAQGYLKREVKKTNNKTQTALEKVRQKNQDLRDKLHDAKNPKPVNANKNKTIRANGGNLPHANARADTDGGGYGATGINTGGGAGGGGGPGMDVAQVIAQVPVTKDGVLQLPYNQAVAQDIWAATNEANSQLEELDSEGKVQQNELARAKFENEEFYRGQKRTDLNTNAAAGTAFSSQYGTAAAGTAGMYAGTLRDLDTSNSQYQSESALKKAKIQNQLAQSIGLINQDYADSLNDEAGDLGYGGSGEDEEGGEEPEEEGETPEEGGGKNKKPLTPFQRRQNWRKAHPGKRLPPRLRVSNYNKKNDTGKAPTKASTTKASTSKGSTSKASTSKASTKASSKKKK